MIVLAAVVVLLAVLGVAALAAPQGADAADVPVATTVTQVRAGESLSEVAVRVAPGSVSTEVVTAIRELNALAGSTVRAGQSLVVPAG